MDRKSGPWADLPQDIVEFIINKLHFSDQIRALAVCKSWRDCNEYLRSSDTLPWAVTHELEHIGCDGDKYAVICQLFDPYSQNVVHKVTNFVQTCVKLHERRTHGLISKNGWLLLQVFDCNHEYSSLVLHNPFTNHMVLLPLPLFAFGQVVHAAMKADPSSPDCEIFVLSICDSHLSINTYCLSRDFDGQLELVVQMTMNEFLSMHNVLYMKGNIYCVFAKGALYSYGLDDKSWKLLTPDFLETCKLSHAWLLEINENIVMVYKAIRGEEYEWMIFRFDWSKMSWVFETNLKSCAIYISRNVAFSAPLTDRYGKKIEGFMLFNHDQVFVAGSDMKFMPYSRITPAFYFVEPPYFVK